MFSCQEYRQGYSFRYEPLRKSIDRLKAIYPNAKIEETSRIDVLLVRDGKKVIREKRLEIRC